MVKQLLSTVYQIKKVVDGPKIVEENGKKVAFYKVRWQDTFEPVYNLPKKEVEVYKLSRKRKAKVLGPVAGNENGHQSLQNMNFAVEVDSNVQILPYKQIKADYKDELISYFEKNARPLADSSNNGV